MSLCVRFTFACAFRSTLPAFVLHFHLPPLCTQPAGLPRASPGSFHFRSKVSHVGHACSVTPRLRLDLENEKTLELV